MVYQSDPDHEEPIENCVTHSSVLMAKVNHPCHLFAIQIH
jgi:hypothetical protein